MTPLIAIHFFSDSEPTIFTPHIWFEGDKIMFKQGTQTRSAPLSHVARFEAVKVMIPCQ